MKGHVQRLLGTLVLMSAGAAIVVGSAYAEPEYQAGARLRADAVAPTIAPVPEVSERPGQGGVGALSLAPVPDWFERAAARGNPATASLAPVPEVSERPGQGGLGIVSLAPVPEVSERPGQGGIVSIQTPIVSVPGAGFAWDDAFLGAGSALGLVLLLGGAVALTMRHRGGMIPH